LDHLLREVEIAEQADYGRQDATELFAIEALDLGLID